MSYSLSPSCLRSIQPTQNQIKKVNKAVLNKCYGVDLNKRLNELSEQMRVLFELFSRLDECLKDFPDLDLRINEEYTVKSLKEHFESNIINFKEQLKFADYKEGAGEYFKGNSFSISLSGYKIKDQPIELVVLLDEDSDYDVYCDKDDTIDYLGQSIDALSKYTDSLTNDNSILNAWLTSMQIQTDRINVLKNIHDFNQENIVAVFQGKICFFSYIPSISELGKNILLETNIDYLILTDGKLALKEGLGYQDFEDEDVSDEIQNCVINYITSARQHILKTDKKVDQIIHRTHSHTQELINGLDSYAGIISGWNGLLERQVGSSINSDEIVGLKERLKDFVLEAAKPRELEFYGELKISLPGFVVVLLQKNEISLEAPGIIQNLDKLYGRLDAYKELTETLKQQHPTEMQKLIVLDDQKRAREAIKQQLNQCFHEFSLEWEDLQKLFDLCEKLGFDKDESIKALLKKYPDLIKDSIDDSDQSYEFDHNASGVIRGFSRIDNKSSRRVVLRQRLFPVKHNQEKIKELKDKLTDTLDYNSSLLNLLATDESVLEDDSEGAAETIEKSLVEYLILNITQNGGAYVIATPPASKRDLLENTRRTSGIKRDSDVHVHNITGGDFVEESFNSLDGSLELQGGGGGAAADDNVAEDSGLSALETLSVKNYEFVIQEFEKKKTELSTEKEQLPTKIIVGVRAFIKKIEEANQALRAHKAKCEKFGLNRTLELIAKKLEESDKNKEELLGFLEKLQNKESVPEKRSIFFELSNWLDRHPVKQKEFEKIEKSLQTEKNKRITKINRFISEQREAFERQILEQNTVIQSAQKLTGLLSDLSEEDSYTELSQLASQKQFKINRPERDGGEIHLSGIVGSDGSPVESGFMTESDDGPAGGGGVKRDSLGIVVESADNGEFSADNILMNFERLKAHYSTKLQENVALTKDMNKKYQELAVDLSKSYRQQKKAFVTKIQTVTEVINNTIDAYKSFLSELDSALYDRLNKLAVPDKLPLEGEKKEVINANEKNEIERYVQDQQDVCTQLQELLASLEAKATQGERDIIELTESFSKFSTCILALKERRAKLTSLGFDVSKLNFNITEQRNSFGYTVSVTDNETVVTRTCTLTLSGVLVGEETLEQTILKGLGVTEFSLRAVLDNKHSLQAKLDYFLKSQTDLLRALEIKARTQIIGQIREAESEYKAHLEDISQQKEQLLSFLSKIPQLSSIKEGLEKVELSELDSINYDEIENKNFDDLVAFLERLKLCLETLSSSNTALIQQLNEKLVEETEKNLQKYKGFYTSYVVPLMGFNKAQISEQNKQALYDTITGQFLRQNYYWVQENSDTALQPLKGNLVSYLKSLVFETDNFDLLIDIDTYSQVSEDIESKTDDDDGKDTPEKLYAAFGEFISAFKIDGLTKERAFHRLMQNVDVATLDIKTLGKALSVKDIVNQVRVLKACVSPDREEITLRFDDILKKIKDRDDNIRRFSCIEVQTTDSDVLALLGLELFAKQAKSPMQIHADVMGFLKENKLQFSAIKEWFMSLALYEMSYAPFSEFEQSMIDQMQRLLIFEALCFANKEVSDAASAGGGGAAKEEGLTAQQILTELNKIKSLETIDGYRVVWMIQDTCMMEFKDKTFSEKLYALEDALSDFNFEFGDEFGVLNLAAKPDDFLKIFNSCKKIELLKSNDLTTELILKIQDDCKSWVTILDSDFNREALMYYLSAKIKRVLNFAAQVYAGKEYKKFKTELIENLVKVVAESGIKIEAREFNGIEAFEDMKEVLMIRFLAGTGLVKEHILLNKNQDFTHLNSKLDRIINKKSQAPVNPVYKGVIKFVSESYLSTKKEGCPFNGTVVAQGINQTTKNYTADDRTDQIQSRKKDRLKSYVFASVEAKKREALTLDKLEFTETNLDANSDSHKLLVKRINGLKTKFLTKEADKEKIEVIYQNISSFLDGDDADKINILKTKFLTHLILVQSKVTLKETLLQKVLDLLIDPTKKAFSNKIIQILSESLGGKEQLAGFLLYYVYPLLALQIQARNCITDTYLAKFTYYKEFASPELFRSFCENGISSDVDFEFMLNTLRLMDEKSLVISRDQLRVMKHIKIVFERETVKVVSLGAGMGKTFCVDFMQKLTDNIILYAAPFKERARHEKPKEMALFNLIQLLKHFDNQDIENKKLTFNAESLKYFLVYVKEIKKIFRNEETKPGSMSELNPLNKFITGMLDEIAEDLKIEFKVLIQKITNEFSQEDFEKRFLIHKLPVVLDEYDSERYMKTNDETNIDFDVNQRLKAMGFCSIVKMSATDNDAVARYNLLSHVKRFKAFVRVNLHITVSTEVNQKGLDDRIFKALSEKYVTESDLNREKLKRDLENSVRACSTEHLLFPVYKDQELRQTKIKSYIEKILTEFDKILYNKRDEFLKKLFSEERHTTVSCIDDEELWLKNCVESFFAEYSSLVVSGTDVKANYLLLRPQADGGEVCINHYIEAIKQESKACNILLRDKSGKLVHYTVSDNGELKCWDYSEKDKTKFVSGPVICCYLEDSVGGDFDEYSRDSVRKVAVLYEKKLSNANNVYQNLRRNRGDDDFTSFEISLKKEAFENQLKEKISVNYETLYFDNSEVWLTHSLEHVLNLVKKYNSRDKFLFQLNEKNAVFDQAKIDIYKKAVESLYNASNQNCYLFLKDTDQNLIGFSYTEDNPEGLSLEDVGEFIQGLKDEDGVVLCCYSDSDSDIGQIDRAYTYYEDRLTEETDGLNTEVAYKNGFFDEPRNLKKFFNKKINSLNGIAFASGLDERKRTRLASKHKKRYKSKIDCLLADMRLKKEVLEKAVKALKLQSSEVIETGYKKVPAYIFTAMLLRWLEKHDDRSYRLICRVLKEALVKRKDPQLQSWIEGIKLDEFFEKKYKLSEESNETRKGREKKQSRRKSKEVSSITEDDRHQLAELKRVLTTVTLSSGFNQILKEMLGKITEIERLASEAAPSRSESALTVASLDSDHSGSGSLTARSSFCDTRDRSESQAGEIEAGALPLTEESTARSPQRIIRETLFYLCRDILTKSKDVRVVSFDIQMIIDQSEICLDEITKICMNNRPEDIEKIIKRKYREFKATANKKMNFFNVLQEIFKYKDTYELHDSAIGRLPNYIFPDIRDLNTRRASIDSLNQLSNYQDQYQQALLQLNPYSLMAVSVSASALPSPKKAGLGRRSSLAWSRRMPSDFNVANLTGTGENSSNFSSPGSSASTSPASPGRFAGQGKKGDIPSFGSGGGGADAATVTPTPTFFRVGASSSSSSSKNTPARTPASSPSRNASKLGGGGFKLRPNILGLPRTGNSSNLMQPANPSGVDAQSLASYRLKPARTPASSPRSSELGAAAAAAAASAGGGSKSVSPRRNGGESGGGAAAAPGYTEYQVPNDENRSLLWAVVIGYMVPRLSDTNAYRKLFCINHVVKKSVIDCELASIKKFIDSEDQTELINNNNLKGRVNKGFIDNLNRILRVDNLTKFKEDLKNGTLDVKILETIASLLEVKIIVQGDSTQSYGKDSMKAEIRISKRATGYSVLLLNKKEDPSEPIVDAKLPELGDTASSPQSGGSRLTSPKFRVESNGAGSKSFEMTTFNNNGSGGGGASAKSSIASPSAVGKTKGTPLRKSSFRDLTLPLGSQGGAASAQKKTP